MAMDRFGGQLLTADEFGAGQGVEWRALSPQQQQEAYQSYLGGAQQIGTPLNDAQKAQLRQQLDSLGGGLSEQEKNQILAIPVEDWSNPDISRFISGVVQRMATATPYDANSGTPNPRDSMANLLNQVSRGTVGFGSGRPASDLFNPVSNVGAANAGMIALGAGGASLLGSAGGVAGAGAGDIAAIPAGGVGGGGASGVGFGTTIGGDVAAAPGYYSGADLGAINSGINPETGLPMDLGQQQLGSGPILEGGAAESGASVAPGAAGSAAPGTSPALLGGPGTGAAAGGAAAGSTALARVMDGSASTADWLSVLGTAGATGLGIYGSIEQQKSANELANKLFETGAPSRARFEASMTPGFDPTSIAGYKGALDTASESILRKLSATGGNPYGSPGGLIEANKQIVAGTALPAVQEYQRLNAGAGGMANISGSAPSAATNAIGSQGNVYNAIGSGISSLTNPTPSLYDTLRQLGLGRGAASAA